MEKKESRKAHDIKDPTLRKNNLKGSITANKNKDKSLPWWVELLFVQIGLPDKWLIKILKSKKATSQYIKNENKLVFSFLFIILVLAYFYPVIKYSNEKLDCGNIAKKYINENKYISKINKKQLNMLSTNFCNGGDEIYEIENSKY